MVVKVPVVNSFRGEYFFLSNFASCRVVTAGFVADFLSDQLTYPSVEHAYQALKTDNMFERKQILLAAVPGDAKRLGKRVTLRKDWDGMKVAVMESLLFSKFRGNFELGQRLIQTGDAELVEGNNWGDTYWGVCNGSGQNWLGVLLMKVRDTMRGRR